MQTAILPFFCDSRTGRNWHLNGCQPLHTGLCLDEICLNEIERLVANGPFKAHTVEIRAVADGDRYVWAAFWADSEVARTSTSFKFVTAGLHAGLRKSFRATA
jgi:hypothetical protein